MIKIKSIEAFVYRFPLKHIVQTSFGQMNDRPMVIVRLVDEDGVAGFGEIWCNYPAVGAEHRAKLISSIFADLISSKSFSSSGNAFEFLTQKTWVLCVQTGEYGPIAQCIAGIDIAINDLQARRASLPLWKFLGGSCDEVATYASGISPANASETAERALDAGHNALKLKIGFDTQSDIQNVKDLRHLLGTNGNLMVDANQAWTVSEAKLMLHELMPYDLAWLEEPIVADRPDTEWLSLAKTSDIPLAGGENIFSEERFSHLVSSGYLKVIQPDLAKWGGLSKIIPIAKKIIQANKIYCPHFLGGGIGLLASGHALAAVGGAGLLEVDCNINPLRTSITQGFFDTSMSVLKLGDEPGLGIDPDLTEINRYRVH